EQRHLLLQRPIAVHHAKQPPLPGIGDVRLRREDAAGRDAHVPRLADLAVDGVRNTLVVDERVDGVADRQAGVEIELVGPRAETGSPKQMFDLSIGVTSHGYLLPVTASHASRTANNGARAITARRACAYGARPASQSRITRVSAGSRRAPLTMRAILRRSANTYRCSRTESRSSAAISLC